MDQKDWTLLVVAAANGAALSPVQLQKALFLIGRELTPRQRQTTGFYKFRPYDYGPFAPQIYTDAAALESEGQVTIIGSPGRYRTYQATAVGMQRAAELRTTLAPDVHSYLDRVVQWVRALSFDDLVRAVYEKYPDMAVNSVFRG